MMRRWNRPRHRLRPHCCSTRTRSTRATSTTSRDGSCGRRSTSSSRAARPSSSERDHEREWYSDFLEFVKRERVFATLLTPAAEADGDPEKRWDTTRICALQRDHRLLRARLLVHVAGLDPRARPDLAERERGGQAARGDAARRRRDLRLRPLRARARRRHLLDRHGADPDGRRRLHRQRRQVLHRQRQRGRDGLDLRPAHRRRGPRRLRLLRRRQQARRTTSWSRTSSTPRCTSASSS